MEEQGAAVGIEGNRCTVAYQNGMLQSIPIETLEEISILGHVKVSTQCLEACLKNGITVSYLSRGGKYFGRLVSTQHINPGRQRQQCALYDTDFSVNLARNIMTAKLKNQEVVLRRYEKSKKLAADKTVNMIKICRSKLASCQNISEIIGYEGQAAKAYFEGLSQLVDTPFRFHGRSRRPPLDPFNSMLSLGYSVLMNEIYSKIEAKGLNPYFGFVHRDNENHPTLASDLMEEWRPVIIDSMVMSLVNGHEIITDDFEMDLDEPGCFLSKKGLKIFLSKLENKVQTQVKYLEYVDYRVSFRQAMDLQINLLVKAIDGENVDIYKPLEIR